MKPSILLRSVLPLLATVQLTAGGASFQAKGTLSFVLIDPQTHVETSREVPFEAERQDALWTISITDSSGKAPTSYRSFGDSKETLRITHSRGTGVEESTVVTVDPVPMPIPGGDDTFVIWLTLLSDSYFAQHTTRSFAPFYLLPDYLTDVGVTFPVKVAWNGPDQRWLARGDWFLDKTYPVWEDNQVKQRIVPKCDVPNLPAVSFAVEEWGPGRQYPKTSRLKRFQPCSTKEVTLHRIEVREYRETPTLALKAPEIPIGSTVVDRRFINRNPQVTELVYTNSAPTVLPIASREIQKLYEAALEQKMIASGGRNRPTPVVFISGIVLVAAFLAYGTYSALKNK